MVVIVTKLNHSSYNCWYSRILVGRQIRIQRIFHMKFASNECGFWLAPSHSQ